MNKLIALFVFVLFSAVWISYSGRVYYGETAFKGDIEMSLYSGFASAISWFLIVVIVIGVVSAITVALSWVFNNDKDSK